MNANLLQRMEPLETLSAPLQEILLALEEVTLVSRYSTKEQQEAPLPKHLRHHQEYQWLEVLPLGLSSKGPLLDLLLLASEVVAVPLPLVIPARHPAVPAVPVAPVDQVFLDQRQ